MNPWSEQKEKTTETTKGRNISKEMSKIRIKTEETTQRIPQKGKEEEI